MKPTSQVLISPKIATSLIIFGNIPLLGQERITIQLFSLLKKNGLNPLFLINDRYSHWFIQPELNSLQLDYKLMRFCAIPRKSFSIKIWFENFISFVKSNWQFYRYCKSQKQINCILQTTFI